MNMFYPKESLFSQKVSSVVGFELGAKVITSCRVKLQHQSLCFGSEEPSAKVEYYRHEILLCQAIALAASVLYRIVGIDTGKKAIVNSSSRDLGFIRHRRLTFD